MKRKILVCSLTALLVVMLATTAYAYMFRRTQFVQNVFEPARVSCKVYEGFSDNTKSSITVMNTGNTDAYIRVRLVFQWQDSKGNAVSRNFIEPTIYTANGWFLDDDGFTYYYPNPVAPGASALNLLDSEHPVKMTGIKEDLNNDGVYYYYYPVMEVVAEAIQANPAGAVESAWGVTVNANGTISP